MNVLFIVFLSLLSLAAVASDKGNGGGVHLCPNNKIQFYDLYEGYTRYNFQLPESNLPIDAYINRALLKIRNVSPWLESKIKAQISYLQDGHFLLRSNLNLFLIDDINLLAVDIGCSYQQIANWDEFSGNVLVKQEYYNSISNLDKAGLILHEAIYKVMREENNQTNSDLSRKLVGDALSVRKKLIYAKDYKVFTKDIVSVIGDTSVLYEAKQVTNQDILISFHLKDQNYYTNENLILKVRIKFREIEEAIAELTGLTTKLTIALEENKAIRSSKKSLKHYDNVIRPLKNQIDTLNMTVRSFRKGLKHDKELILKPGDRLEALGFDIFPNTRPLHYEATLAVELNGYEVETSELNGEFREGLLYSLEFKVTQNYAPVNLYP